MNQKQSLFFRFLRKIIRAVTKPMKTLWQSEAVSGPSVFVCNHDSAYGPIAMCAHFELYMEICPWINAQTLHMRQIPAYVRGDFWWRRDKWYTKLLDYTVAYIAAPFMPLINRGSACIPVYHDSRVIDTLRGSVAALKSGKHIVLFPEHPTGYRQYGEEIYSGFVALGRLLHRRTGQCATFFPTFIDWSGKEIRVGAPMKYDPDLDYKSQTEKIVKAVEEYFRSGGKAQERGLSETSCGQGTN